MNYIFKERLRESALNFIGVVICLLVLDAGIACCIGNNIPAAFIVIAWVCISILALYAVAAIVLLLCYWVKWLFIDPFKKSRF